MLKHPIQADNIQVNYDNKTAVDLSIYVKKNEVLGLVGVNGSGKTTTLNALAGVIQPNKGSIYINEQTGITKNISLKKLVSYLPEEREEIENLTVFEYLSFISKAYSKKSSDILPALKKINADDVINKQFSTLSKGYQQRILFAGILIANTPIMILDEMSDGLDPLQKEELYSIINEIKENKAIIVASHNLQEIKQICDRVCIINNGKITQEILPKQFDKIEELLK